MIETDKFKLYFSLFFRLAIVVTAVYCVITLNWLNLALCLVSFFLTFFSSITEKRFKIDYPNELEVLILLFIACAIFLGNVHQFYNYFLWWDLVLHTLSGFAIGGIGFNLVYILNKKKISINLRPAFIALFAFNLAMSIGVLWEIFEFLMDVSFGFNMQRSGLVDTMWDLIVNTIGAGSVSLVGYIYLKSGEPEFINIIKKRLTIKKDL